jgi:RimJ/RimL family protein N-acetyltransferase
MPGKGKATSKEEPDMTRFEIRTERLVLKPLGTQFLDSTNEYALDPENTRMMIFLPHKDSDETVEYLKRVEEEWDKEKPEFCEFAVMLGDKHVGTVDIGLSEEGSELGWIINRRYQGQGIAYEATKAMMDHFAHNFGVKHFTAHCDTMNKPSYSLMEKLGMKRTGEYGGRRNRFAQNDTSEYLYELFL